MVIKMSVKRTVEELTPYYSNEECGEETCFPVADPFSKEEHDRNHECAENCRSPVYCRDDVYPCCGSCDNSKERGNVGKERASDDLLHGRIQRHWFKEDIPKVICKRYFDQPEVISRIRACDHISGAG